MKFISKSNLCLKSPNVMDVHTHRVGLSSRLTTPRRVRNVCVIMFVIIIIIIIFISHSKKKIPVIKNYNRPKIHHTWFLVRWKLFWVDPVWTGSPKRLFLQPFCIQNLLFIQPTWQLRTYLITAFFVFNEFAFTVQVKTQIVHKFLASFRYVCLLRLAVHFHT